MKVVLDTNRYTDAARGVADALGQIQRASQIYLTFVTLGELRGGFSVGRLSDQNERHLQRFLDVPRVSVLYADAETTRVYARVYADLRRLGKPIPTNDMWIAALTIQHGLVLATRDRHFAAVPDLVCA